MKHITQYFLTTLLLFTAIFNIKHIEAAEQPLVTVTTSFLEDIVTQIAEDTVEIALIVPAGGDPHIYNASARDLQNILEADVVLYHGLHFEAQMAAILVDYGFAVTRNFSKDDLILVAADSQDVDPHYWFNIELYKQSVEEARDILIETFPTQKDLYTTNADNYLKQLDELAKWIEEQLAVLPIEQRVLVTPHDAFEYFARTHDFIVYAPQGISTESEVSNEQIIQTVQYIIDHQVPAIFLDTTSNPQAMEKLQEGVQQKNAEVQVVGGEGMALFSDSLAPKGQANDNYIDMYKHNISLIVQHLVR